MAKLVDLDGLSRYNTKLNEKLESTYATKGEVPSTENLATKDELSSLTTAVQESFTAVDEKINLKATASDLSTVATSGSYNDLSDKPEIPSVDGLATEDFVNSSISTNTATFKGTVDSVDALNEITDADENDYAFVVATDDAGNTQYNRYKYASGAWAFEYTLNNSSFTAEQWSAINSGITSDKITTMEADIDNKVVKNSNISANASYYRFPTWDAKGLITGHSLQAYKKNVYINGVNIGPLFGTTSASVGIPINEIKTLSSQYIRITDLSTGIYQLTYSGAKYIYYDGTTGTSTHSVGWLANKSGNFLLFVNKQTDSVWNWHYFYSSFLAGVSGVSDSYNQVVVCGTTQTDGGQVSSRNVGNLITESDLEDKGYLTGITSDQVTTALGYTPYDSTNPNGYITSSDSITGNASTATNATKLNDQEASYYLDYSNFTNTPTIPTVNNATLTIQKNGTSVGTFTSNASSNATINITVPTNNNELTNGAGYVTSSGSVASATKATQDGNGNVITSTYATQSSLSSLSSTVSNHDTNITSLHRDCWKIGSCQFGGATGFFELTFQYNDYGTYTTTPLLVQWGTATPNSSATITLPKAFKTANYVVVGTPYSNPSNQIHSFHVSSYSTTSFTCSGHYSQSNSGRTGGDITFRWLAIGY